VRVELVSDAPEATARIAAAVVARLVPGDVVLVRGEIGAGKTTFVRGACRALGIEQPVTSPTFTIGHRYHGAVDVSHLDLYRFQGLSAAEWGDLEPYFDDAIAFVEWPEEGVRALPAPRLEVLLEHETRERRRVVLETGDPALLEGFAA
jgi:tRNA threonylcarbamoyladenosine biosynthesis protein TsaE